MVDDASEADRLLPVVFWLSIQKIFQLSQWTIISAHIYSNSCIFIFTYKKDNGRRGNKKEIFIKNNDDVGRKKANAF